jgi:hypothetical protein
MTVLCAIGMVHFLFAVALALLGSLDEARAAARVGLSLHPGFTIRRFQRQSPSHNPTYLTRRERFYEGIRHGIDMGRAVRVTASTGRRERV